MRRSRGLFEEFRETGGKGENRDRQNRDSGTGSSCGSGGAARSTLAIREEIDADDKMNEAIEEHDLVHVLIAELKKLKPSDERFEAVHRPGGIGEAPHRGGRGLNVSPSGEKQHRLGGLRIPRDEAKRTVDGQGHTWGVT